MNKWNILQALFLMILLVVPAGAAEQEASEESVVLDPIEVVGDKVELFSGKVKTDRIEELQSVDIGDLLKKDVEGMGTIRKSGVAFDPILRGLSKDRLNVLVDGGFLFPACLSRMDTPTFHITPYSIKGVTVTKGPFDVTMGPGSLGGIINVETKRPAYSETFEFHPVIRAGFDSVAEGVKGGITLDMGRAPFGANLSYDYKDYGGYDDGDGKTITSDFEQENFTAGIRFFIDENKSIGINYIGQRAEEIYYPVLGMDSPEDDMDMISLEANLEKLSSFVRSIDVRLYANQVDHLMDNAMKTKYVNPGQVNMAMTNLAESRTLGGKLKADLALLDGTEIGVDYYNRWWDATMTMTMMGPMTSTLRAMPDTTIEDLGFFVQPKKSFGNFTLTTGIRVDLVNADADGVGATEAGYFNTVYGPNTTSKLDEDETNVGAFLKGSHKVGEDIEVYAGVGRGVRTADAKERFRVLGVGRPEIGNPDLDPEESLQFEAGFTVKLEKVHLNASAFHNSIDGYIAQYDTGWLYCSMDAVKLKKTPCMMGMAKKVLGYKNVDARLYGGELSVGYLITDNVSVLGSASYTWAKNEDDEKPLQEIPPLEGKLGIRYDELEGKYWVEFMGRFVASQHRFDPVVDDGGKSSGFETFDLRLGWRPWGSVLLTAGVENIFDLHYTEHTTKTFFFNQDGYTTADRVPEPGMNAYANITWSF
jgi:iron complex outermembrane receptor protein